MPHEKIFLSAHFVIQGKRIWETPRDREKDRRGFFAKNPRQEILRPYFFKKSKKSKAISNQ